MATASKSAQLQIRVSRAEKGAIARAARRAGMGMSAYVLDRVLGFQARRVAELMRHLADEAARPCALAELNDLLCALSGDELRRAVGWAPPATLAPEAANYVAAMVEYACVRAGIEVPAWTRAIASLPAPLFGSRLESLRLHLLATSPAPFRRRNIYIDTSLGGRV